MSSTEDLKHPIWFYLHEENYIPPEWVRRQWCCGVCCISPADPEDAKMPGLPIYAFKCSQCRDDNCGRDCCWKVCKRCGYSVCSECLEPCSPFCGSSCNTLHNRHPCEIEKKEK